MWCNYCKDRIEKRERYIKDRNGNFYHKECYEQMNTFVDDFGETITDEFGDSTFDEYGY